MRKFIREKLEIKRQIQFQRVHRLEKKIQGSKTPHPIIVRFVLFPDHEAVWHARTKLENTNIFIREDFPEKVETECRTLLPIFLAAKKKKETEAKLVANKLFINKERYTVDTLDRLPTALSPRNVSEKIIENEHGDHLHLFQGRLSPFSNFYRTNFVMHGQTFNSSEQRYLSQRAIYANCPRIAEEIMNCDEPSKMKSISRKVKVNEKMWLSDRALEVMEEACYEKFAQHSTLKDILLETKGYSLVECNRFDENWAIGLGLHDEGVNDVVSWKGKNMLRTTLGKVCERLA